MGTPGLPAAPAPTPRLVLAGLLSRHTWPLLRAPPPLAATPAPRRPRSWKFPRRAVSHDPFFSSCVGCAASYRGSREPGRHRRPTSMRESRARTRPSAGCGVEWGATPARTPRPSATARPQAFGAAGLPGSSPGTLLPWGRGERPNGVGLRDFCEWN